MITHSREQRDTHIAPVQGTEFEIPVLRPIDPCPTKIPLLNRGDGLSPLHFILLPCGPKRGIFKYKLTPDVFH